MDKKKILIADDEQGGRDVLLPTELESRSDGSPY